MPKNFAKYLSAELVDTHTEVFAIILQAFMVTVFMNFTGILGFTDLNNKHYKNALYVESLGCAVPTTEMFYMFNFIFKQHGNPFSTNHDDDESIDKRPSKIRKNNVLEVSKEERDIN